MRSLLSVQRNHHLKLLSPTLQDCALELWAKFNHLSVTFFCQDILPKQPENHPIQDQVNETLWFGAATAVSLWFPEQKRPYDLIFCCHWYRILNVRLFRTPSSLFSVEDYGIKFGSKLRSLPFISGCWASEVLYPEVAAEGALSCSSTSASR